MVGVLGQSRRIAVAALVGWATAGTPGTARAAGVPVDQATDEQKALATQAYERGTEHFSAGEFEQAVRALRESFDIVASPNARFMLARALASAGRNVEAYDEILATAVTAVTLAARFPQYQKTADHAGTEAERLRKKVGLLTVRVAGAAGSTTIRVTGREGPVEPGGEAAVEPGRGEVTVTSAGGRSVTVPYEIEAGGEKTLTVDLAAEPEPEAAPPPEEPTPPPAEEPARASLRPFVYVAGGVGAAGLITFAVAGSKARATFSDLEESCPNDDCPTSREGDIDRGKTQRTVANVGLAFGVVGLGAGAALFFLDRGRAEEAASDHAGIRWLVGPRSVGLRGKF